MTSTQALMGSPLYMAPEQMRSSKNVDARADIWSMGVILYEMLAGRPPFAMTGVVDEQVVVFLQRLAHVVERGEDLETIGVGEQLDVVAVLRLQHRTDRFRIGRRTLQRGIRRQPRRA